MSTISKQISNRDLSGYTKIKHRQTGQGGRDDLAGIDFKADLHQREEEHARKRAREDGKKHPSLEGPAPDRAPPPQLHILPHAEDADDPHERVDDSDDSDDEKGKKGSDSEAEDAGGAGAGAAGAADDDDDDDEDDTEELMRELQRIKRERLEEQSKKEAESAAEREKVNIMANPLLRAAAGAAGGDFSVKRRWDDDVVFKNCARQEKRPETEFVNDTLRSAFHRKFMSKYII